MKQLWCFGMSFVAVRLGRPLQLVKAAKLRQRLGMNELHSPVRAVRVNCATRFVTFFLALALTSATGLCQNASAAPTEDALFVLCKLWNVVRFISPDLRDEADGYWDEAVLQAIGKVEGDPSALTAAAAEMLTTLHDPGTSLVSQTKALPPSFALHTSDEGALHELVVRGVPAPSMVADAAKSLRETLRSSLPNEQVLIDLRLGGVPTAEQRIVLRQLWSAVGLASSLADSELPGVAIAARQSLGFPSENPNIGGSLYHSGVATITPIDVIQPSSSTQARRVSFVVDATSYVPTGAIALVASNSAAIFSEDGTNGDVDGDRITVDAGLGIKAWVRTTGPTSRLSARPGALMLRVPGCAS